MARVVGGGGDGGNVSHAEGGGYFAVGAGVGGVDGGVFVVGGVFGGDGGRIVVRRDGSAFLFDIGWCGIGLVAVLRRHGR